MFNLSGALMDNGLMARLLKMRVAFRLRQLSSLKRVFGVRRWHFPDVYLALFRARFELPEYGGYARQGPVSFELAGEENCRNRCDIVFPTATADWLPGPITRVALLDSAKRGEGKMLWDARLEVRTSVSQGDTFMIKAGDLSIFPAGEDS